MASLEGIKRRVQQYRPRVQSAFIVYTMWHESPVKDPDTSFEIFEVESPDDPVLDKITAPWQEKCAKESIRSGRWKVLVALKDGEPVGRIWEAYASERRLTSGIPRVRLAPDEVFLFDLFVEREFRRSNIGMTMADFLFDKFHPDKTHIRYVYGFISYENSPSILWHHSVGFNVVQTINYLEIGPRIKWKIPFSDVPRFGPLSRKGRYNDEGAELFGTALFPNL